MPRQERTKSGTGIYHVMLRGINKQDIFEDDEDYLQMTSIKTKMITEPSLGHYHVERRIYKDQKFYNGAIRHNTYNRSVTELFCRNKKQYY